MAMGALRALASSGVSVPEEVSVTGFDDSEDSRFCIPSLTTVQQGAHDLGVMAIRSLAGQMGLAAGDGTETEPRVSFIVRESCGCRISVLAEPGSAPGRSLPEGPDPLAAFSLEVNQALARGRNPAHMKPKDLGPGLRNQALLILAEGIARYQVSIRRSAERRAAVLREIEAALVASFSLPDILSQVARGTKALGISACWLALFEPKDLTLTWARLLLASEGTTSGYSPLRLRFKTADLSWELSRSARAYVCEPSIRERGWAPDLHGRQRGRRVFEAIRDQVSAPLRVRC
jgi:hypothetical protein